MTLRASRPRGLHAAAWGLGLAALVVAQAGSVLVVPNVSIDALYAERLALSSRFEVVRTEWGVALLGTQALGTAAQPAEITEAMTPAGTLVMRGDATYAVTVRERVAESVPAGNYSVEVSVDGRAYGPVYLTQGLSNPLLQEGARVVFDLGGEAPAAPLVVLSVKSVVHPGAVPTLRSFLDGDPNYRWKGSGGDIEGVVNPDLAAQVDVEFLVTAVNGDGTATHNLRIKDGAGNVVAGPTPDLEEINDEATLAWTPAVPGTYRYECQYHATTQRGNINVTT